VVWAAGGGDEATLFALAAGLAAALPLGLEAAGAVADRRGQPGARSGAYRELRAHMPTALAGGVVFAALALLPTLGADPVREPWIVPLRAAAAGGGVAGAAALLPALFLVPSLRRRSRAVATDPSLLPVAAAAPAGAEPPAPPTLAVHNVSKAYRGGTALRRVSFELGPGIIGLPAWSAPVRRR
jgi:hypothetical protein